MTPTTPPTWTPIAEVEWVDGALYWMRQADGETGVAWVGVVEYPDYDGAAGAMCLDVSGMTMGCDWDDLDIIDHGVLQPDFVGVHVSGPLTPPAWGEEPKP